MKISIYAILICYCALFCRVVSAQNSNVPNSTIFTNPVINSDFPDPDIIRVGDDFYLASSTYVNVPGITILHSRDLVHWEYLSHVVNMLTGRRQYDFQSGDAYRSGINAPSLRYNKGKFYIAVTPAGQKTQIFSADDPKGPWLLKEINCGAFDPALFFDEDGTAYIVSSGGWDGTVTLLTLNDTFDKVIGQKKIHYLKGAQGSKIYRIGNYYYLFNSIAATNELMVSRAETLAGPWMSKEQLNTAAGCCQGGVVDLPDGSWYGYTSINGGAVGRTLNLSPVLWEDGWPVWGDISKPGELSSQGVIPIGSTEIELKKSDDFADNVLGLQWQWNHNPDESKWNLTDRPGWLRLKAGRAENLWMARNTLVTKAFGPHCRGDIKMDLSKMSPGDICGFGTFGKYCGGIAVHCGEDNKYYLRMNLYENTSEEFQKVKSIISRPLATENIYLRVEMDFRTDEAKCFKSADGSDWKQFGEVFPLAFDTQTGTSQGQQFCIFCYNPNPADGYVDLDYFKYSNYLTEGSY